MKGFLFHKPCCLLWFSGCISVYDHNLYTPVASASATTDLRVQGAFLLSWVLLTSHRYVGYVPSIFFSPSCTSANHNADIPSVLQSLWMRWDGGHWSHSSHHFGLWCCSPSWSTFDLTFKIFSWYWGEPGVSELYVLACLLLDESTPGRRGGTLGFQPNLVVIQLRQ